MLERGDRGRGKKKKKVTWRRDNENKKNKKMKKKTGMEESSPDRARILLYSRVRQFYRGGQQGYLILIYDS